MKWLSTKNNKLFKVKEIPVLNINELSKEIIERRKEEKRIVLFFGQKIATGIRLFAVMADDEKSRLFVSSALFKNGEKSYPSISQYMPSLDVFEREFFEEFGIKPLNHPWLKPVRYSHDRHDKKSKIENYPFFKMQGDKVHEVAVGPVHAGIIEPGHFRFMANGENVYHLEIQLGYQHRGIEKLFLEDKKMNFKTHLAESIAGDSTIAHVSCYAMLVESLMNMEISKRAMAIRAISLELERAAVHTGDLGQSQMTLLI